MYFFPEQKPQELRKKIIPSRFFLNKFNGKNAISDKEICWHSKQQK